MSTENDPANKTGGGPDAVPPRSAVPGVLIVTGPSGAGRSTAIRAMEDADFEAVDNLPLPLVPHLLEDGRGDGRPLALGIDVRTRDFTVEGALALLDELERGPRGPAEVLYLDCAPEVLARRFSETRRRHPLAPEGDVETGIALERALLAPLADRMAEIAGGVIDTTDLTPHDLRARVQARFAPGGADLAVSVQSFSYKRGLPAALDMAFDVRFLRNPHWETELRPLTGLDPAVASHVRGDPNHDAFHDRVRDLILSVLPAYRAERRAHLAIGFGCTGGRHRSVAVAEGMAAALAEAGWGVSIRHRDLDRQVRKGRDGGASSGDAGAPPGRGRARIEGTMG
jgi:UPF0042 nucleotide-binding protein